MDRSPGGVSPVQRTDEDPLVRHGLRLRSKAGLRMNWSRPLVIAVRHAVNGSWVVAQKQLAQLEMYDAVQALRGMYGIVIRLEDLLMERDGMSLTLLEEMQKDVKKNYRRRR